VHEATHGHYCLRRIGYPAALRHRIERICMREQLAFARTLPGAHELCAQLERNLSLAPSVWTSEAFKQRYLDGERETARQLGIPDWVIKSALIIGAGSTRLRRLIHRITSVRNF
jgi:hypothetical protein